MWPLRSMLLVPAQKLDWVRKVARFGSDAVVLDVADAVPPDLKASARQSAREGVTILAAGGIPAFVSINPIGYGAREDILAIATEGFSGVILPKVQKPDEVRELDTILSYAEGAAHLPFGSISVVVLPETAEGLWAARDLAAASKRVKGLLGACGPFAGDIAHAVGFRPTVEGTEQLYLASKIVLDSRAGGAPYPTAGVIGGPLNDLAMVKALVQRARGLGYAGAVVAHPSHVAVVNDVYTPTKDEIDYARGLLAALRDAEARGLGATQYRGAMIDYASRPIAEEVLREAARRGIDVHDVKN